MGCRPSVLSLARGMMVAMEEPLRGGSGFNPASVLGLKWASISECLTLAYSGFENSVNFTRHQSPKHPYKHQHEFCRNSVAVCFPCEAHLFFTTISLAVLQATQQQWSMGCVRQKQSFLNYITGSVNSTKAGSRDIIDMIASRIFQRRHSVCLVSDPVNDNTNQPTNPCKNDTTRLHYWADGMPMDQQRFTKSDAFFH